MGEYTLTLLTIESVLTWIGPVVGSLVTAGGALALARLRKSGKIATTEAERLWTAAELLREELHDEIDKLRTRLDARYEEIAILRGKVDRLEREHRQCVEENGRLNRELETLQRGRSSL